MAWSGSFNVPSVAAPSQAPGGTYVPFQGIGAGQTAFRYAPQGQPGVPSRLGFPAMPTAMGGPGIGPAQFGPWPSVQPWNSPTQNPWLYTPQGYASTMAGSMGQPPPLNNQSTWGMPSFSQMAGMWGGIPNPVAPTGAANWMNTPANWGGATPAASSGLDQLRAQSAGAPGVMPAASTLPGFIAPHADFPAAPPAQTTSRLPGLGGWTINPAATATNWNMQSGVLNDLQRQGWLGPVGGGSTAGGWAGPAGTTLGGWTLGQQLPSTLANRQLPVGDIEGWGGASAPTYGQFFAPWTPQGQAIYSQSQIQALQQQLAALQAAQQPKPAGA